MSLSKELQDILSANDSAGFEVYMSKHSGISQAELDRCLGSVMPAGSLDMIKVLLDHGSKLTVSSTHFAIARQDSALFQLLLDHGWDINSTEFGRSPVQ